jgi:hypothetical protein
MTLMAICYQETGEEGILHADPGETSDQLRDRVPEEWSFRRFETRTDRSIRATTCDCCGQHPGDCQC